MSKTELQDQIKVFQARLEHLQAQHLQAEYRSAYEYQLARRIQNLQVELEIMEHEHGC